MDGERPQQLEAPTRTLSSEAFGRLIEWIGTEDDAITREVEAAEASPMRHLATADERRQHLIQVATLNGRKQEIMSVAEQLSALAEPATTVAEAPPTSIAV